jgi:hypothetical protein
MTTEAFAEPECFAVHAAANHLTTMQGELLTALMVTADTVVMDLAALHTKMLATLREELARRGRGEGGSGGKCCAYGSSGDFLGNCPSKRSVKQGSEKGEIC